MKSTICLRLTVKLCIEVEKNGNYVANDGFPSSTFNFKFEILSIVSMAKECSSYGRITVANR